MRVSRAPRSRRPLTACALQIEDLRRQGLQCVGWYHSHPTFPVLPSSIDVYNQHAQQVAHACTAAVGAATPYIAAIVGPYWPENGGPQSHIAWFYVENRRRADFSLDDAPADCLQHMVAKRLDVELDAGAALSREDVLAAARPLVRRYARHAERVDFTQARARHRRACATVRCAVFAADRRHAWRSASCGCLACSSCLRRDHRPAFPLLQMWQGGLTNLQKLASSVQHTVRGHLLQEELRALGTSLIELVWRAFYTGGAASAAAEAGGAVPAEVAAVEQQAQAHRLADDATPVKAGTAPEALAEHGNAERGSGANDAAGGDASRAAADAQGEVPAEREVAGQSNAKTLVAAALLQ
jgi:JAB1/Mov34/MPN/PAD-1 ubiquitin protease